ncbi:MAG: 3-hydroxyacyl-CoA dehydrogenase NAD-binding domain-containing protein [Planctomycetota bacterium]|nr:3-hydroxyacyl-CoA dehydrogenase NAD-binding domain-containing protein [Planctomycetota bacterium]
MTRVDDEGVAVVTIDNPPVNALSTAVARRLQEVLCEVEVDATVQAVVLAGAGRAFVAGADIREFEEFTTGRQERGEGLHPLLNQIENARLPYVCAVHGLALGAGLELAMACHYRVALQGARLGQPEVKLGLIPGAGGTQRLPRLVGLLRAAEMCAGGELVAAERALEDGLIDRVCSRELTKTAVRSARQWARRSEKPVKTRDRAVCCGPVEIGKMTELKREVERAARGASAPLRAMEAVQAASDASFDRGIEVESGIFRECLYSDESKARVHLFFGEREAAKRDLRGAADRSASISEAAVVGAGTMGRGIAMAYANAGIPVVLQEQDDDLMAAAMARIRDTYRKAVRRGRMSEEEAERRCGLISPTRAYAGFERAGIVVEAVYEGMELKRQVFAELDKVVRSDAILATNTSTLDIDDIAAATSRPEAVIGNHFFSPAAVMRLLEIIVGERTSGEVVATSLGLAKRLGKVGVVVGNCPGFVGNRMYGPYQREAQFLVEEGVPVAELDSILVGFGMAMGPLAVADLAGLDVGWRIRREHQHLQPAKMRPQTLADGLCQLGRFGQKTGRGFYRYADGGRVPEPDPAVEDLAQRCARRAGIQRRTIDPREVEERTLYALINEGARILEGGYARSATDIDIVYVNGYGFPAHRGGPMWYADQIGLERILTRICEFEANLGFWWKPAPLLQRLVKEGRNFADLRCTR